MAKSLENNNKITALCSFFSSEKTTRSDILKLFISYIEDEKMICYNDVYTDKTDYNGQITRLNEDQEARSKRKLVRLFF